MDAEKQIILEEAMTMLEGFAGCGLELTSALKQAASDHGIPYGEEMGEFVAWAYKELGIND
tara:strand:+ start:76 stop:258 length:183 start_codon:yes stop_codon:yes gene_type:complete